MDGYSVISHHFLWILPAQVDKINGRHPMQYCLLYISDPILIFFGMKVSLDDCYEITKARPVVQRLENNNNDSFTPSG